MRVQLLGPVQAWRGRDELRLGGPTQKAVFALLAMSSGRPLPRAELVSSLWPAGPPASAANVIQTHIKRLRRIVEPDRQPHGESLVLPAIGDGYALRLPVENIDIGQFRRLLDAATKAQQDGDKRRAAEQLDLALRLWQGPPAADVPILATHPKVVMLLDERRAALARYSDAMIATGAAADVLPALQEAVAGQPLDEAVQARLIRAYHADGQRDRAFATYRDARRLLADELGVDPGAELTAAHDALLHANSGPAPGQRIAGRAYADSTPDPPPRRASAIAARSHPVPAQLPADVSGFTGRIGELARLDLLLTRAGTETPDPPPAASTALMIAVVSGTAGVGKTALVVHWAHRVRERFPDGQLYANMRGHDPDQPLSPDEVLARFLTALGINEAHIPLGVEDRAARYRTEIAGRRMLIVLDNAASVEQVRLLLPGTPSCVVAVTSRDSMAGLVALHGARRIDLSLLPIADSVTLLGTLIGERVAADPDAAAALADSCVRLPLALRVAAELATTRPTTSLPELVAELADQRRLDLLEAGGDARAAIRTVFSWSYTRLPADARRVFRLLGAHPGPEFEPYAVAALAGTEVATARRLVETLARAHLIEAGGGRFGLHDLLRAYAADLVVAEEPPADRRAALNRLFDYYLAAAEAAVDALHLTELHRRQRITRHDSAVPPLTDAGRARAWLDAERLTLSEICAYGATHGWPLHTTGLAAAMYRYLEGGHLTDALTIHRYALQAADESADLVAQARALTNLGAVYRLLGQYGLAADHLTRAVTLYRDTDDRYGEARALSNLGIVDERVGRHEAAATHHEQALSLYRTTGDRYGEASTLNNLGSVSETSGRYHEAIDHYRHALALYGDLKERVGEAVAASNIGIVYIRLGRYRAALEHQHRALATFREIGHRYGEAAVLNNLGDIDSRTGRHDTAVEHQRQAVATFRELGHRYGEATALNGLGEALHAAGSPAEARFQHASALQIAVETGDQDERARAHNGLALAYLGAGEVGLARDNWRQALSLYTEMGSPNAADIRARLDLL